MIQANPKLLNADEFIAQYGDQDQYELIDGKLIDLEPTGLHVRAASPQELQVIDFLA